MAEPTALDTLNAKIVELEAQYAKDRNMWTKVAIDHLKDERQKWYAADGSLIPVTPAPITPVVQISPPEVVGVDGWWTFVPTGYGNLPWWGHNIPDINAGLELSVSRDNGCFIVKNQRDTATLWLNDTDAVAKRYKITPRLVKMVGHRLNNMRYMLPTDNLRGGGPFANLQDYALNPEVPFNDEEKRVWRQMFVAHHFGAANLAGADFQFTALTLYPAEKDASKRVPISPRLHCVTVGNHPEWVVPVMMSRYNNGVFIKGAYRAALHEAHQIDNYKVARVPGYEAPPVDRKDYFKYYNEFEDGATAAVPKFQLDV